MHVDSTYTIRFNGNKDQIEKMIEIINEAFQFDQDVINIGEEIKIEEERELVWPDVIESELALKFINEDPEWEFEIEGYVDQRESTGELYDFKISYKNKVLKEETSEWYSEFCADDYEDYDEFAEEFIDEDGDPLYTEDDFENFKEFEDDLFVLDGKIVNKINYKYEEIIKVNLDK